MDVRDNTFCCGIKDLGGFSGNESKASVLAAIKGRKGVLITASVVIKNPDSEGFGDDPMPKTFKALVDAGFSQVNEWVNSNSGNTVAYLTKQL